MTESDRIKFLIKHLAGGNASNFAKRVGIEKGNLSKITTGKNSARLVNIKILDAYPQVNREWLETGEGYPGDITVELVKAHFQEKIDKADKVIDHLMRRIDDLEKRLEAQ